MAGDFNLEESYIRENTEDYKISRNAGPTRKGRYANTAIDHVISTFEMTGTTLLSTESKSDHIPIMVEISASIRTKPEAEGRWVIKK